MPYIGKQSRERLKPLTDAIKNEYFNNPAELNYLVAMITDHYLDQTHTKISYQRYNDVIGALEANKLELYRRSVSDYEDKKIKENGDLNEWIL